MGTFFRHHESHITGEILQLADLNLIEVEQWCDLISGSQILSHQSELRLDPYQTVWITNKH